jgi:hypothetical protein
MEIDMFVADMQLGMFGFVTTTHIYPIKTATIYCLGSPAEIMA